ncbi:uncharacterized protein [Pleurodeles waltl]|uniref:uncharacterized protein n=1 Tax=Pleurodeles waltl TaxID=8319 RepID=UPI0037096290
MKLTISLLFMALSGCLAISSDYSLQQQSSSMKQEDAYYFTRCVKSNVKNYQRIMQSTSKDREFKIKCSLHNLLTVLEELSDDLGCSVEDVMRQMGYSQMQIQEMRAIIQGSGSVENIDPKKCENLLDNMLTGVLGLVKNLLGPLLGTLSGVLGMILGPNGLVGGLLGGNGGLLEGLLGGGENGGLLNGLLGGEKGGVGGLLGR